VLKFLPKFDFAKVCGVAKIEIITQTSVQDLMNIFFNSYNIDICQYYENKKFYNYEETKDLYEKLPDDIKWLSKGIATERSTSVVGFYTKHKFFPMFFNNWIISEVFDEKNGEYKFYVKLSDCDSHGNESKNIFYSNK
jgi:hypothetical protein